MANDEELALVEPDLSPPADIPVCDVCYEVFHRTKRPPRLFPCGHTFCQPCINSLCLSTPYVRARGVQCATCRRVVHVMNWDNPTDTFPPNFAVLNLIEKYEESELNKSFACFHCKLEFHEKLMTFCETCFSRHDFNYSERDFLGRPNSRLMCGGCANIHHVGVGHSFLSLANVNGRWNYRTLYKSCSRAARKQESQIDAMISAFEKGIEAAKQYKTNLNETVLQMEAHADERSNRVILRNFMKNSVKSSAIFTSIRESVQRLSEPNSEANRMLGSSLFPNGLETNQSDARVSDTAYYKRMLEGLFTKYHNVHNRNSGGSAMREPAGSSQRTSPPVAQAAVQPAPRVNQAPQPDQLHEGFLLPLQAAPVPAPQVNHVPQPAQLPQGLLLPLQAAPVPVPAPQFAQVPVVPQINVVPIDIHQDFRLEQMQQYRNVLQGIGIPQFQNLFVADFAHLIRQQDIPQNYVQEVPNLQNAEDLDAYRMLLQVQPALFEQRVNNNFEMELPLLFQPVMPPPVAMFTADNLNIILDLFCIASEEQRAMIVRDNQFGPLIGYHNLAAARRRTLRLALSINPPPRRPESIVLFYSIPFHFFNALMPALYNKSLGDVIRSFIISLDEEGHEVYEFFFNEPNGDRNYSMAIRNSIKAILMSLMIILIPGQFPYTYFERALQSMENQRRDEAVRHFEPAEPVVIDRVEPQDWNVVQIDRPPVIVPVEPEPEVIVLGDADDDDDAVGSGSEHEVDSGSEDEDEVDIPSGNEYGNSDDEHEDEAPMMIREELRAIAEQVVVLNDDPNIQEVPVQRRRVGRPPKTVHIPLPGMQRRPEEPVVLQPNNEVIRDLRRQDRHNFVFQIADLLPEPPARATRAAKRRAHEESVDIQRAVPGTHAADPEPEPVRRGRGRPRKYPRAEPVAPPSTRKFRRN